MLVFHISLASQKSKSQTHCLAPAQSTPAWNAYPSEIPTVLDSDHFVERFIDHARLDEPSIIPISN